MYQVQTGRANALSIELKCFAVNVRRRAREPPVASAGCCCFLIQGLRRSCAKFQTSNEASFLRVACFCHLSHGQQRKSVILHPKRFTIFDWRASLDSFREPAGSQTRGSGPSLEAPIGICRHPCSCLIFDLSIQLRL